MATHSSSEIKDSFSKYTKHVESVSESVRDTTKHVDDASRALDEVSKASQQITSTAAEFAQSGQRLADIASFGSECTLNAAHVREAALPVLDKLMEGLKEDTGIHILANRLFDHALFLNTVVSNVGKGFKVKDHTQCAFGHWYTEEGKKVYGHLPIWKDVDQPHRLVHTKGAALAQEARADLAEDMANASLELLNIFVKLKEEIARVS